MSKPLLNEQFPKASHFASWALSKAHETMDALEDEETGELYQSYTKVWQGTLKSKGAPIVNEIGAGRIYLVNEPLHQVWIENRAKHVGDFGSLAVGETLFKVAKCCRCQEDLFDIESAKFGACEDCQDLAGSDPEAVLEEFISGQWG